MHIQYSLVAQFLILGLIQNMNIECARYFGMVKENYYIHGKRFECPYSTLLLVNVTCDFRHLNRTVENWSLDLFLKPGVIVTNLYLKVTVYRKTNTQHYRPTLVINATVDICANMAGIDSSPILGLFIEDIKQNGNVFHPCPYSGHNYIKNHSMQVADLPPIIPAGEYIMIYIFYTIWKKVDHVAFQIQSYFDVIPRGIKRF